ncbi:MAG: MBL fold metallo-hydrolase [Nitrospirae bacterium]|nr:MBL fold metallo-hydrolase [Nitrospirota bacterium]
MTQLEDEFGDIIKKARNGLGLSLNQLSASTGISADLLEEIEAYRFTPSEREVELMAGELGLNADKLNDIAKGRWYPEEFSRLGDELSDVAVIEGQAGSYKVNGYLLMDKVNGLAVGFDTGNNSKKVLETLKNNSMKLTYVFLTHGHFDHTGGVSDICRVTGAGIGIPEGEDDIGMDDDINKNVFAVKSGSGFKAGLLEVSAVVTPGHTPGSTCYIAGNYCFSGDTIFAGSVGRAYNMAGYNSLLESVRREILSLDRAVHIFPGHGPASTVGEEIMHNPFS